MGVRAAVKTLKLAIKHIEWSFLDREVAAGAGLIIAVPTMRESEPEAKAPVGVTEGSAAVPPLPSEVGRIAKFCAQTQVLKPDTQV